MNFMIVRSLSPYNGIIGRPGIREIQAVPSTAHGMLKFPVDGGIVTIRSTILIPVECATVITSSKEIPKEAEKKRGQAPERAKAIQAKVQKLVETGIIREIYYHEWLSNPVMVKKHDGSWRMCVDFTDLNKACPQDCYPLSKIDWKVKSLCGYPFKCFLDAYKGYHQIWMAVSDEEKMAFHTSQRVYCYTKMPFGLKNAGATYQRLVDKAFDSQVRQNIKVYVDDLVIKSHTEVEMLRDIMETFHTLRKINMKLNPKECTFGAMEGMFLGFMISPEGIKLCPEKTEVSTEKSLPLFKTLKKCIKKKSPLLVAPKPKEELIVYMSATHGAISAVLMTKRSTVQTPVYFVSRALQGPELNYTPMEKLVLSLVFAAKRLRSYFQAHPIAVITEQPMKQIISRPDMAGRLQKWSVMLGEHNITYRPRTSVKGQILTDFFVEKPDESPSDTSVVETPQDPWTLFTDGSSCVDRSGAGLILTSPEGTENGSGHTMGQQQEKEVTTVVEEDGPTWMTPIIEYLKEVTLPNDKKEASKLRIKAKQYELLEGILYRCMHAGPRSVLAKAMRLGYYWPTMHHDARDMIRICNDCQIHRPVPRNPQQPLTHITAPWPFYKWGIDIAGPFPEGPEKVKFFIVVMDYFTKWIEAKVVATITGNQVKKFVWDNIICRFCLLGEIVSDSGKQFSDNPFKDWCKKLNITQCFALVKHPQFNGLVERANRSLGKGIKARLCEENKNWIKELPHVLWAHRTMIKSSHGDIPFSLTYGTEAVIPAEIRMPTYRIAVVDVIHNNEELQLNLDLLKEQREYAAIRKAKAKLKMKKYYIARVRGVTFRPGDFVYRSNDASHAIDGGKLGQKWEGPYEVTKALEMEHTS
ncbi:reverse transcriptase domain-containing protein [Tanacetum coccineum]